MKTLAILLISFFIAFSALATEIEIKSDSVVHALSQVKIPAGVTLARVTFPGSAKVKKVGGLTVLFERTLNDGISWESAGGKVFAAGSIPEDFNVSLDFEPNSSNRMLRGWFIGSFVPITLVLE